MDKLKPCPFCGGEAKIAIGKVYTDGERVYTKHYVECTKCGAATKGYRTAYAFEGSTFCVKGTDGQCSAIKEWQRRAIFE